MCAFARVSSCVWRVGGGGVFYQELGYCIFSVGGCGYRLYIILVSLATGTFQPTIADKIS